MAIKTNVQLPRSNRMGVKPRADELEFGMLAVNYAAGDEFLSTKNSNKEVVVFPSKNYIEKHPFSSLTIDNLAVNSGASISGNSTIGGSLRVSGDTYLGGATYLESGNTLVAIENFITETANAGANNYVTDGTAVNNTITLKRKDLPDTTITDVVTKDKIAEEVVAASNGKFVHTTGDTVTGTLNFTTDKAIKIELDNNNFAIIGGDSTALHITADEIDLFEETQSSDSKGIIISPQNSEISLNKINFDGSSSIQNLTDETSSKSKLNIVAEDEHLYYNGNPIANLADSLWKAGTGNSAVLLKNSSGSAVGEFSVSEGKNTTASGSCSHAEGNSTTASGNLSHAEGNNTTASSYCSHTEGLNTSANGNCSHAEGLNTSANGNCSHAEGDGTTASGSCSHAEGYSTTANGESSHAEGRSTTASGNFSHAEGLNTSANGNFSHAEGYSTTANGESSHAEGDNTTASGNFSHAEGQRTIASSYCSHTEGTAGIAYGSGGHVEGIHTQALNIVNDVNSGDTHITVLFYPNSFNFNLDYYNNCYICGPNQWKTRITGASYDTTATIPDGAKAIRFEVEGALPIDAKQADEEENNRHGTHFYTWKYSITNIGATRDYAQHAEGEYTMCIGNVSHAEGKTSMAVGDVSHAEGQGSIAYGDYSHAEGNHTIAMNEGEHACGSYNRSASGSGQVFSVGVGTSNDNRVNSFYVKNDGTIGSDLDMSISGKSKITLSTSSDKLIMSAGTLTTNCTMTSGAYFTTSDERLKTNIIGVTEDEIEKAKKVDLKSFNLKRDGKKHFGVVAQEVEAAGLAELVNTDSEGMKSVDYTSLLILKIAELEKEIKDLKNQINKK